MTVCADCRQPRPIEARGCCPTCYQRRRALTLDERPRRNHHLHAVACFYCHAPPGVPCRTRSARRQSSRGPGRHTDPHRVRREAAHILTAAATR